MKDTKIEWATHTFNPWIGCQKVSSACKFCYAETLVNRFGGDFAKVRRITTDAYWQQPIQWNREAEKSGTRPRVFCASLADVFEDWDGPIHDSKGNRLANDFNGAFRPIQRLDVSLTSVNDVRKRLFWLIDETPNLDWLLLTKRPENIRSMYLAQHLDGGTTGRIKEFMDDVESRDVHPYFRRNVWLGTTVENQEQADKRIPELLKCRDLSPVLFLSCEPLLGPVDIGRWTDRGLECSACAWKGEESKSNGLKHFEDSHLDDMEFECPTCGHPCGHTPLSEHIDWVIVGGESGHDARPMHPDWARSLRDQCQSAQVPFHFKQWGEWRPYNSCNYATGPNQWRYGKVAGLAMLRNGDVCVKNNADCPSDKCETVNAFALSQYHRFGLEATGYQWMHRVGKKAAGRLLDGREWNELPTCERSES